MIVTLVGSGPSCLSAASTVKAVTPLLHLQLLEKGREAKRRICPVDLGRICHSCAGRCNVISGFGGSMHYGDSIKLSKYPSGRRLLEHIGYAKFFEHEAKAQAFFGAEDREFHSGHSDDFGTLKVRNYPVAEIGEQRLATFLDHRLLEMSTGCRWRPNTRLTGLDVLQDGRFSLSILERDGESTEESDVVVFGTGRSGIADTQRILKKLGIGMKEPAFSLGIRIEMPAKYLQCMYSMHRDFKYSQNYDQSKVKSFCFSTSATRGGRLKFCHYQDQLGSPAIFLDGHSHFDDNAGTGVDEPFGNFALLVQKRIRNPFEWVTTDLIPRYMAMSKGKPFYQSLSSFLDDATEESTLRPSVVDLQWGRIHELFDFETVTALKRSLVELLSNVSTAAGISLAELLSASVVIAPELEGFWPGVDVSEFFETDIKGLYVVGDAAGIAQGVMQAAISGNVAGHHIAQHYS